MFWARVKAIEPLLKLGMKTSDFEEETGQIDGTLAHSIERSLCFIAEKEGYLSAPISSNRSINSLPSNIDLSRFSYRYASLLANKGLEKILIT